ncbi:MAG: ComEC/Rec2 family competence protein [Acutalibacteraceae bacterium]
MTRLDLTAVAVTAGAALLLTGILLIPPLRQKRALALITAVIALAAGRLWVSEVRDAALTAQTADYTGTLEMEITGEGRAYARSTRYPARVTAGDLPAGTTLYLWVTDVEIAPQPYDRVSGEVQIRPQEDPYALSNRADGMLLSGLLLSWKSPARIETPDPPPWQATAWRIRRAALNVVGNYLYDEDAAIVRAACLGDRADVSGDTAQAFRDAGTAHLLVVSGLHLGIAVAVIWWLLRKAKLSRRVAALAAVPVVVAFMLVVGMTPSIRRAGVMTLVMLAGYWFKREADPLNSLGLALLLIGFAQPYMVWDVGLQLSVGATLGILVLFPKMDAVLVARLRESGRWRWLYRPAQAAAVSLSATMAITPFLVMYFGKISLVFLPANLLMVFPATVAVIAGWIGILTGGWFPFAARLAFALADVMAAWLRGVAEWFSRLPLATVSARVPFFSVWMLATVLALGLLWKRLLPRGRAIVACGAASALMLGCAVYQLGVRPLTTCTVWRSDNGTAVLAEWPRGSALIVGGSDAELLRQVNAALDERGVERLSVLAFSTLDGRAADHLTPLALSTPIERVAAPETGRHAATLRDLFTPDQLAMGEDVALQIGEDHTLRLCDGGVELTMGQTRLILGGTGGDVSLEDGAKAQMRFANGETVAMAPGDVWRLTTRGQRDIMARQEGSP